MPWGDLSSGYENYDSSAHNEIKQLRDEIAELRSQILIEKTSDRPLTESQFYRLMVFDMFYRKITDPDARDIDVTFALMQLKYALGLYWK